VLLIDDGAHRVGQIRGEFTEQGYTVVGVVDSAVAIHDTVLREQLSEAQMQLAERKLVDRAKGLLMQEVGLSEDQAHRHLRKLAMDRGQRLGEVAERILAAHDLLKPPG
jgi:AmiR/NasT family two-component response regulator